MRSSTASDWLQYGGILKVAFCERLVKSTIMAGSYWDNVKAHDIGLM